MIGGVWTRDTIGWVLAFSLAAPVAALLVEHGLAPLVTLLIGLATVAVWQIAFRVLQGIPLTPAGAVTAAACAVLASGASPVQIVLAVSFGTVIGELVFGGWGRNVFSPAAVALAFLYLSYPAMVHAPAGALVLVGCALAAALLVATGIASWHSLAATALGWGGATWALGADIAPIAASGTLAFAVLYLMADPVASAVTRAGRWGLGTLAGAMTALLSTGTSVPQAVVFAALLASIFAPLIDQGVIAWTSHIRRKTHG